MFETLRQKAVHFACRTIQSPRIFFYKLISTTRINGSPRCLQPVQCVGLGTVSVDAKVTFGVFPSPLFFSSYTYLEARSEKASISIGAETWINNNFSAIAEHSSIRIGKRCLIGHNVEILDSDFHGLSVEERGQSRPEWAKSVFIGDEVFIGAHCTILKGVTIGAGSVIAHGSVVTKDVPAGVIAAGSPAKVIGTID